MLALSCNGGLNSVVKSPTPVTASAVLTPDRGAVVFTDDFSDSNSGWSKDTTADFKAAFGGSGYVIVARNFIDHEVAAPYLVPKQQLSIAVRATESLTPNGSGFGAACDRGLKQQTISYDFAVQVDGTWDMVRHDLRPGAANPHALLKQGTSSKAPGAASITVELMCATLSDGITTRLVMFVDNTQVADMTYPVTDLPRLGWVGGLVVRGVDSGPTTVTATHTSNGLPTVTRSFSSFSDAVAQVADARVFAGFHFRFSCNDASSVGAEVANYAESTLMQRADGETERLDMRDS
jgi:hypothetical protein